MAKKKPGGGRAKGQKNLVRKDDYIINQFGIQFTEAERKRLNNVVRQVNRRRAKLEREFENQPLFQGGKKSDADRAQLKLMGKEMDLMIRKRSASLQQFTSKAKFEQYIRNAEKAASFDYMDYRGKLYKKNLIKAIEGQYGTYPELVKGVKMKLQMMPQNEFQKLIGSNLAFEISYVYSEQTRFQNIMDMREVLGLRSDYDDYQ